MEIDFGEKIREEDDGDEDEVLVIVLLWLHHPYCRLPLITNCFNEENVSITVKLNKQQQLIIRIIVFLFSSFVLSSRLNLSNRK